MKVQLRHSLTIFILLLATNVYSQNNDPLRDTKTNAIGIDPAPIITAQDETVASPSTLNFNCATVFWTIDNSSNIRQWNLSGGQVTGGTVILQALNSSGIGFSNSAFYSAANTTVKKYTDAAGWTSITLPPTIYASNNGGYGNHQYFAGASKLYHYDGTTFTQVAVFDSNSQMELADIAVDSLGRAWVFHGSQSLVANKIRVYDSNGLVAEYPFTIGTNFAYGSFFMNDTLYIAFGNNFQNHSEQIVPIFVNNGVVTEGTPISFPYNGYHDLASCNSAGNLAVTPNVFEHGLIVSPNPVKDVVSITTPFNVNEVEIFDVSGKLVISTSQKDIDVSKIQSGMYLMKVTSDNSIITKRLIKE